MACFFTALSSGAVTPDAVRATFAVAQPVLMSCLEDDDVVTRRTTACCLEVVMGALEGQLDGACGR